MLIVEARKEATDAAGMNILDTEVFCNRAVLHVADLDQPTIEAVKSFKTDSGPSGYLLLGNIAVGELTDTPESPISPSTKDDTSELSLIGIASLLGEPVGYLPELGGRIVQNLVPIRSNATAQTSTSSSVTLMWHTETAFHPYKPRYLVLLCLKGEPGAQTLLCSIDSMLSSLSSETIAVLSEPRFRVAPDRSFRNPVQTDAPVQLGSPIRVLDMRTDDIEFTFDADLMVGMDSEATEALEGIRAQIERHQVGVELNSGDLLAVDNHRAVHGRSAFKARFDGTDRWLQRTFVVSSLAPSAGERIGRTITTTF